MNVDATFIIPGSKQGGAAEMTTAGRGEKSFPPLQLFFTETDHQCKMRRKTTT